MFELVNLTMRQNDILLQIRKGSGAGGLLDIDQLRDNFKVSKQAMQFSVRFLIAHGMIRKFYETRRGRRRVCYQLTLKGHIHLSGDPGPLLLGML